MNSINYWIKKKLGLIDKGGVNRINYLLMKVDYLSTELHEAKEQIFKLEKDVSGIHDEQHETRETVSNNEYEIDSVKSDLENHNIPYLWEIVDNNKDYIKNLEVPDEYNIREIIKLELDALKGTNDSQETIGGDSISNERLITGIVRSEIAQYNKFIVDALNEKSFD